MTSAIEFTDVLAFYEQFLAAGLVANDYPQAKVSQVFSAGPGEFVWLQRDGGSRLDLLREAPLLRVNCLSDLHVEAFGQRVRTLIWSSLGAGPVRKVREITGPTEVPNIKPWRYMLFELTVVGSPLTLA